MTFITDPQIKLIGKPVLNIEGIVAFMDDHGYWWPELERDLDGFASLADKDAEWIVETGGRNCYQSWAKAGEPPKGRSHDDHIKHLIDSGHHSCLEHANLTFMIWNVSRSLSHELVRHRLASYSQPSQRYVDSSDVNFIVPQSIQQLGEDHPLYTEWKRHCEQSVELYEKLTSELSELYRDVPDKTERRKLARQASRSVLPNATETKIMITMNIRSIRHFIKLRASRAADLEIRRLAVKMYHLLENAYPVFTYGMYLKKENDGTETVEFVDS